MQRVAVDSSIQIPNDEATDASLFQGTSKLRHDQDQILNSKKVVLL
jgi:hypothetical protein